MNCREYTVHVTFLQYCTMKWLSTLSGNRGGTSGWAGANILVSDSDSWLSDGDRLLRRLSEIDQDWSPLDQAYLCIDGTTMITVQLVIMDHCPPEWLKRFCAVCQINLETDNKKEEPK